MWVRQKLQQVRRLQGRNKNGHRPDCSERLRALGDGKKVKGQIIQDLIFSVQASHFLGKAKGKF